VDVDLSGATMQKKIRNAQLEQYNYVLVVGQKEESTKTVNIRTRDGEIVGTQTLDEWLTFVEKETRESTKSTA
jgi:threonyl-tRNA synthetase